METPERDLREAESASVGDRGVEKDLPVIEGIFEASALKPGLEPIAEADRIGILGDEEVLHLGARPALLIVIVAEAQLDLTAGKLEPRGFWIGVALFVHKAPPGLRSKVLHAPSKVRIRVSKALPSLNKKTWVLHAKRGRLPCPLTARDRD